MTEAFCVSVIVSALLSNILPHDRDEHNLKRKYKTCMNYICPIPFLCRSQFNVKSPEHHMSGGFKMWSQQAVAPTWETKHKSLCWLRTTHNFSENSGCAYACYNMKYSLEQRLLHILHWKHKTWRKCQRNFKNFLPDSYHYSELSIQL